MKKYVIIALILALPSFVHADLGDQITATLTDHVSAHTQYTTKGENRLALLDSIIIIGKYHGASIAQGRFGFTGIANPSGGVDRGAGYVADVFINAAPFIRDYVHLDDSWIFLNSLEVGPSLGYDFRSHHSIYSVSVGLAFGLNPHP